MTQATSPKLRRKDIYYFDLVVFQVEDVLFKVPKNHFSTSSVFATIFTLPPGENDVEGTEDKPFVLHGIGEADFESLLKFMYPPPLTNGKLTQQEWISVLKLCTMWEFNDIREKAIQELSKKKNMGPIEKIEHGKSYEVKEWVLEGYVELLKRAETVTSEEAERLGWKTAVKLILLREQYLSNITAQWSTATTQTCVRCQTSCGGTFYISCGMYGSYHPCGHQFTNHRDQYDFTTAVRKELEAEAL